MNRLLAALLVTLVAGCATTPSQQRAENPPKHAKRVQIGIYDSSPRAKSDHIDIYDETHPILKPHKEIALVTCEGTPSEESPMIEAIIYRARMVGANAVIILPPSRSGWGDRRVFRAKAVIYETP
jgi:hypothetical protein